MKNKMEALLVIDVQYDFLPGGALEVKDGDEVIPVINNLLPRFKLAVGTQDWHPANHSSFASNNEGAKAGEVVQLHGHDQIMWPDHCVQDTEGAELSAEVHSHYLEAIFRKGTDPAIDSYSGFYDNNHEKSTGLADYLRGKLVDTVYVTGLAADYCVKFTALDALKEGFNTMVVTDATRAVNMEPGDFDKAMEELQEAGAELLTSDQVKV